jgi:hypothetical protein
VLPQVKEANMYATFTSLRRKEDQPPFYTMAAKRATAALERRPEDHRRHRRTAIPPSDCSLFRNFPPSG